jgi:glycosyltransferase involved in cell wall biosynthesis
LQAAIDSVLGTNLDFNWELWVTDDASIDGTAKIVEKYAQAKFQISRIFKNSAGTWEQVRSPQ